ncbi:MAG: response regulator transcription factor [Methylococcaceae bacterium]|nr:response regulator transcription factor [Methylococcaceae bacterium]
MIRILIADDHTVVRQGIKEILADYADMAVTGEAATGIEVMQRIREQMFDILILDMSMPGRCGIELIKQIKTEKPTLPILIFSMHEELQYAVRSLKAGASGYLIKNSEPNDLAAAIHKLMAGGHYFSPAVAEKLAEDALAPKPGLPHERLTDREFQIFESLVKGKTVTAIAGDLCLSVKTVSTHHHNILEKMGIANRAELVRYALEYKLEGLDVGF